MKIEYEKQYGISVWHALLNGKLIGKIVVENYHGTAYLPDVESRVFISDHTLPQPALINPSPFASVNQAKAALEYHFRNLTETA